MEKFGIKRLQNVANPRNYFNSDGEVGDLLDLRASTLDGSIFTPSLLKINLKNLISVFGGLPSRHSRKEPFFFGTTTMFDIHSTGPSTCSMRSRWSKISNSALILSLK